MNFLGPQELEAVENAGVLWARRDVLVAVARPVIVTVLTMTVLTVTVRRTITMAVPAVVVVMRTAVEMVVVLAVGVNVMPGSQRLGGKREKQCHGAAQQKGRLPERHDRWSCWLHLLTDLGLARIL